MSEFAALQSAEAKLGRTMNPTVYTPANWHRKRKEGNAFAVKVEAQCKVFLMGTKEDLACEIQRTRESRPHRHAGGRTKHAR